MNGNEVRRLRIHAGLSQRELAFFLQCSLLTVGKIEREEVPINHRIERRLHEVFMIDGYKRRERASKDIIERRKEVMARIDRRVERWNELPDDDADLVELRELYNVESKQAGGVGNSREKIERDVVPGIFYTKD